MQWRKKYSHGEHVSLLMVTLDKLMQDAARKRVQAHHERSSSDEHSPDSSVLV